MTIEAENICKSYNGVTVIDDFSLDISSDSSYAIYGGEGSGKTTLLRILLGLEKPDSGRVRLLGDYKYSRVNAGVVFQEDRLCEGFSAVENVAMMNKKLSARIAREELEKLIPGSELDKRVKDLPEDIRRLVCIIRACIVPADIILMDEPFRGLNDAQQKKAVSYIRSIQATTPLVIFTRCAEDLAFCKAIPVSKRA